MENQPHHHRGDHAEKDMDKRQTAAALSPSCAGVSRNGMPISRQATPRTHHHGEVSNLTESPLQRYLRYSTFKPQQVTNNNHMTGTGNRVKKLCQTLKTTPNIAATSSGAIYAHPIKTPLKKCKMKKTRTRYRSQANPAARARVIPQRTGIHRDIVHRSGRHRQ
ncbi:hypothetical protein LAD54_27710 [Klebsiella pneumoniae]|nr:hypothetical protein [Klebsiella pneumoniae]